MVRHHSASTYGVKSLAALGPKIWKKLPINIKPLAKLVFSFSIIVFNMMKLLVIVFIKLLTSMIKFKEYIRTWFGPSCKCSVCRMVKYFF